VNSYHYMRRSTSNSEISIEIHSFLTKLQTKISWLFFMAHHTLVTIFSPLYTIHISQTHLYHLCRLTLLFSKYYSY